MSADSSYLFALLQSLRRPMEELLVGMPALDAALSDTPSREVAGAVAEEAALLSSRLNELLAKTREERATPLVVAVDDEANAVNALRELLSPEFEVLTTTNPHEALRWIRERRPDAVVSDLRMPEMSGYSLVDILRGDEWTADIPCVFVSAAHEREEMVKALDRGACDYLIKPVLAEELSARLRGAIKRSRELRDERTQRETDELTGLPNRRAFRLFVDRELRRAQAFGTPLSVAMIDQDRLKYLNDRYGHRAGDDALRTVAQALSQRMRKSDLAARIGGDEFAVVMVGADRSGATRLLEKVSAELGERPFHSPDPSLRASFSFGIAAAGERPEETWEQLLERADGELYAAKHRRRVRAVG